MKSLIKCESWTIDQNVFKAVGRKKALSLKILIGKEHGFLQNFAYIWWRIMPETIFNQKQVLQGSIFIIYSYC